MKLGTINIGTKKNFYSHPVDFDNNTTSGFGFVQPLFSKFLEKDEALKLNFTQEVLLSPTVCPSYARMSVHNQARFVKMCDVFPAFDALLSHMPINGSQANYIPSSVPFLRNRDLLNIIFGHCYATYYEMQFDPAHDTYWTFTPSHDLTNLNSNLANTFTEVGLSSPFSDGGNSIVKQFLQYDGAITFDGADFVVLSLIWTEQDIKHRVGCTFKMDSFARRLYKIFKGLGYSLSLEDNDTLSFLPLLAYYKAWFDSYAPQRFVNWHLTNCYKLINTFYNYGYTDIAAQASTSSDFRTLVYNFIDDLSACFYSYPSDYLTAHTISPVNDVPSTAFAMDFPAGGNDQQHALNDQTNNAGEIPYVGPFGSDVLNNYTLRALSFMAKFVQKNSIIGGRISQYIRNHYNMDVSDDMFADSTNLGDFLTECSIEKVLSTADTSQEVDGQQIGEKIGSYAGFGRGQNQLDINFSAPGCGFYIILTSVVPFSSYCQGNGNDLYMLDRYTFPSSDYDALGLELTPRHSLVDTSICDGSFEERNNTSFGWIPRQSKYKVFKNILNGCMAFRSTQNSYLPYCFDKIITTSDIQSYGSDKVAIFHHDVPNASVEWRYCNKYPWLSMWNRIFYNSGEDINVPFDQEYSPLAMPVDDNFIIQTRFNGSFKSKLKPLSQSFDLIDDEEDKDIDKLSVD